MRKFKVVFEFLNELGEWVEADLTNNDKGFTFEEAEDVIRKLRYDSICIKRYLRVEEM